VIIVAMILTAIGAWFLLSILTTAACAAVVRGGIREDRMLGYVTDSM
jgi:uncharacterized membrane protein YqiK